jgi:Bacteriophage Lambda NinG protein
MLTRRSFMSRSRLVEKPPEPGSRKWLIAELDRYTSLIVRRRDRRCVTCGSRRNLQCSHFYSRRYLAIRFDLRNCNAMCSACNIRHNSDPFPYMAYMQEHYGPDAVLELHELRMSRAKVADEELARLLESYKRAA